MSVDGTSVPVGTPKQLVVLAMLLLNRNRAVSVESLINAAWEKESPGDARGSIHVYVSNLRRLLGTGGVVDPRTVLQKAPPGYRLNVAEADLDLGRFIREKAAGVLAASNGEFERASHHLSVALSEWRGAFLGDLHDFSFVRPFAIALMEDKISAHVARSQSEMACARAELVIGELEMLVAEHPFQELLWAELMTAYYLANRQSDALEVFQRVQATLADELGIDPNPTICALHQRILRQEPLNIKQSARTTAGDTIIGTRRGLSVDRAFSARLRVPSGNCYPLCSAATRIGRHSDNDIVLTDRKVSRHHAVIIDTGSSFVINDAGSANGIEVAQERIRGTALLHHGDHIRIGASEFIFEICTDEDP
jgi:DNA-binding SARP family transcriptional activator